MALIKCPECGKEVSSKATVCPHCGISMDVALHGVDSNCPLCKSELRKNDKGMIVCKKCGFVFLDNFKELPLKYGYEYAYEEMKVKDLNPPVVFAKATEKFNKKGWEVVAVKLLEGEKSLLRGQSFSVAKRKPVKKKLFKR